MGKAAGTTIGNAPSSPAPGAEAAASEVSAGRTSCSNGVGAHTASSAFNGASWSR